LVLAGQEKTLGREAYSRLLTMANLGVNYKDSGQFAKGIPLLEKVHRAAAKDPRHRWIAPQLFEAYALADRQAGALKLADELLPAVHESTPPGSPQRAQALAIMGMFLVKFKEFVKSEPILRESLALREKFQPDAWSTFNSQSTLGGSLLGQMKYAEAEPLLLKGYEGMKAREKTIPPQGRPRLAEALERLVQLYEVTGKEDEAARWRKELKDHKAAEKSPQRKP
jgi:hypothetical protein